MLASHQIARDEDEDYTDLKHLLATHQWQAADRATAYLILQGAQRELEGWLRPEDVARISIHHLTTLDRLWLEFSGDRFGFSVQQQVWHETEENYTQFGDRIGWRHSDSWLDYSDLTFHLQAPAGHLPALPLPVPLGKERVFSFVLGKWRIALLSRQDLPHLY
ncbi:MAG: GUN4 domain-containing protein [Desertifilum sp. SIO1I2]|nr:GUN4 domain-containing protein [Desertifilum sp. SIO1I2]